MKHKTKRLLCLLLTFLIVSIGALSACSNDQPQTDQPPIEGDTPDETPNEPEDTKILPNLPKKDFNQAEFHCLHWNLDTFVGGGWMPWEEIALDDPTGDVLDDQVYGRNAYVEETYNAVITTEYCRPDTELPEKIRAAVSTNDDTYQFMVTRSGNLFSMWTEGYFKNLRGDEMQYLDFEKPWWNQSSLDAFTFGNVTQFAASEMLLLDKGETNAIFFSTTLQSDHDLPNFYQMVEDGSWTWEALRESAEVATRDLNGDDTMDANDQWGSAGNRTPLQYLYAGAGYSYGEIDENGYLTTKLLEEDSIDFMIEIHDEMIYQDSHAHSDVIPNFNIIEKFKSNEVLFTYYTIKLTNSLRDMDSNYGILPTPKYDEYQENYRHLVSPDGDSIMGVPISCGDTEFVSIMLEAISAESYYTVYPTFYDVILMSRYTRDPQSRDMLQLIFDTRVYDTGLVFGYNQVIGELATYAANHYGDSNLSSFFASKASTIEMSVEIFNELIDDWN